MKGILNEVSFEYDTSKEYTNYFYDKYLINKEILYIKNILKQI